MTPEEYKEANDQRVSAMMPKVEQRFGNAFLDCSRLWFSYR
jgi:hypothetical protein